MMKRIKTRHIIIIVLSSFIFSLISWVVQKTVIAKEYVARTTVAVKTQETISSYSQLSVSHYMAETFAGVFASNDVIAATADSMNMSFDEVREKVKVTRKKHTVLIKIDARDVNPNKAIQLSKEFTDSLNENLAKPLGLHVEIIEEANEVIQVSGGLRALLAGAAIGAVLGFLYVFLKTYLSDRFLDEERFQRLGVPVLGTALVDKRS